MLGKCSTRDYSKDHGETMKHTNEGKCHVKFKIEVAELIATFLSHCCLSEGNKIDNSTLSE